MSLLFAFSAKQMVYNEVVTHSEHTLLQSLYARFLALFFLFVFLVGSKSGEVCSLSLHEAMISLWSGGLEKTEAVVQTPDSGVVYPPLMFSKRRKFVASKFEGGPEAFDANIRRILSGSSEQIETRQFADNAFLKLDKASNEMVLVVDGVVLEYHDLNRAKDLDADRVKHFLSNNIAFSRFLPPFDYRPKHASREAFLRDYDFAKKELNVQSEREYKKLLHQIFNLYFTGDSDSSIVWMRKNLADKRETHFFALCENEFLVHYSYNSSSGEFSLHSVGRANWKSTFLGHVRRSAGLKL